MAKVIFATHHRMADGMKETLEYIAPGTVDIIALSAYLDNSPVEDQIEEILKSVEGESPVVVFTDLLGGSVNQEFTKKLPIYDFHLVAGVNLPVALTIAMQLSSGSISRDNILSAIEEAREQIVYVNDVFLGAGADEDDE